MAPPPSKKRVFVVEDEAMVSMMIQDMVEECGCEVAAVAFQFDDALSRVESVRFDLAILDVNLNGKYTFPIAAAMKARGIAFAFATGYGSVILPAEFQDIPVLQKPFDQSDFEKVLVELMAGA